MKLLGRWMKSHIFLQAVFGHLNSFQSPPLTGPKSSTRKEEGCCQEGHPSVKVSQSRIISFNSTTMNARASPVGDAVHTRPSGLTNVRGLPRQDRWARLKKQVGRLRVVS